MSLVVVTVFLGTIGCALYVGAIAPRLRHRRIASLHQFHRPLISVPEVLATTQHVAALDEHLRCLSSLEEHSGFAATKLRESYFPVPASGAADASLDSVIHAFEDPRLTAALAGGEQLFRNAVDMAIPGAIGALADHAWEVFVSAAKDALVEHGRDLALDMLMHGGKHVHADVLKDALHEAFHAGVHEAGMDMLQHAPDAFDPDAASGAHFPWLSLLVSAHREVRLLANERTDIERSIKHLALDTAGVWAGAKAGAVVGGFLGPLGMLGGAVLGAIAGREVTNDIKRAPLRRAIQAYEAASERETRTICVSAQQVRDAIVIRAEEAQRRVAVHVGSRPRLAQRARASTFNALVVELLAAAEEAVVSYRQSIENAYLERAGELPPDRLYHRCLGIGVRRDLGHWLEEQRTVHDCHVLSVSMQLRGARSDDDPFRAIESVLRLRLPLTPRLASAISHLNHSFHAMSVELAASLGTWAANATRAYRDELSAICEVAANESHRHGQLVLAASERLRPIRETLRRERTALGMT